MEKKIIKSDKIFLAGANGMVGSAVKRKLIQHGYGNPLLGGKLFTPSRNELDLQDNKKVEEWFKKNKPDIVIIAAAKVGGILANSTNASDFILNNLKIQTNIIENAWINNTRRLLFLGSSCIYPRDCDQPIKEDYLLTGSLESTNQWYAIAKIAGIKLCQALRLEHGFDAINLMPTNLYGPGDNYDPFGSHVMASFIRKFFTAARDGKDSVTCWGTGNALREFLHVDDLGEAIIFTLEEWDPRSIEAPLNNEGKELSILNVGTGKDISIRDLAEKISKLAKFKGDILWDTSKPDGTPKKQLCTKRINKLGWQSKITLDEGIKKTLEDYAKLTNSL